jgi:hypothetical protein
VYALLGYLALALLMTYPLVREFGRAIPGDGFDGWQNVWNLWWVKRALLVEGSNPYFTRLVDYPQGVYLYFHTLNIFNGLTFLPFELNAGPLVAYNMAVVFSFVAGGYGAYLLGLYVVRRISPTRQAWRSARLAAFLGGVVFAFSPYHMAHLLGHMQLISLEWLPFFALFAVRQIDQSAASRSLHWRTIGIAALFLVLVAACDWYYAFYMALFSGLYLLWAGWQRRGWRGPALALALTGLLFLAATSPVLAPMAGEALRADYMVPPAGSTERLSADLTAFVTPSELHPVWGEWASRWAGRFTASTSERTVFAGYGVLLLAGLALWNCRRAARFWGLAAATFAVLALGPVLHVGGSTRFGGIGPIPLPYALLHQAIPLLKISRSVSRFDVVVMLSLSVLAAIGLYWLLNRGQYSSYNEMDISPGRYANAVPAQRGEAGAPAATGVWSRFSWLVAAGALVIVAAEFWVAPYPMSAPETRPFHYQLLGETGTFALMDVPMDWDRPANLLHQTVHQKPTVSGYTSRTNPMAPAWRTPVLQTFRYLGPDINTGDPHTLAATVLSDLDVRYVIVHKNDLPPGDYREATLGLADDVFAGWPVVVDDEWLKVYRAVEPAVRHPYLVLGEGWAPREWRNERPVRALAAPVANVRVHLPEEQKIHLELDAQSLEGPATLEIRAGDQLLGRYPVTPETTRIKTPGVMLPAGESRVSLGVDSTPERVLISRISLISDWQSLTHTFGG